MTSKAQMEILGLAIIMVIVVVLILFGLFLILQPSDSVSSTYLSKGMAANTLNAIIGTTTECSGIQVKELIQDCASDRKIKCFDQSSCTYVKEVLQLLLTNTFRPINQYYFLESRGPATINELSFGDKEECEVAEYEASTQIIPTRAGRARLKLMICNPAY